VEARVPNVVDPADRRSASGWSAKLACPYAAKRNGLSAPLAAGGVSIDAIASAGKNLHFPEQFHVGANNEYALFLRRMVAPWFLDR
jgi:hypothetical protein